MAQKPKTLEERQIDINNCYGENEYILLEYKTLYTLAKIKHRCGNIIEKDYRYIHYAILKGNNICPCSFSKTGPKGNTIKSRQLELDKLFDKSYKIIEYKHTDKPVTVKHKCGYQFNTKFHALRVGDAKCRCLHGKNPYLTKNQHQKEINSRYGKGYNILKYKWVPNGQTTLNTYKHLECGYKWQASRFDALHFTRTCPKCRPKNKYSKQEAEHYINSNSYRQYDLIEYKSLNSLATIRCKSCKQERNIKPTSKNYKGFGCLGCGDILSYKTLIKDGKKFKLRGFEPYALEYLIDTLGYKVKNLKHERKFIPIIKYKFANKWHNYYPDFYHKPTNTIIEVKSMFTLGLLNSRGYYCNSKTYLRNKAKAKAVIKKGYKFMLILIDERTHKPIELPKNWYNYSSSYIREFNRKEPSDAEKKH